MIKHTDIDHYIASFPEQTQLVLDKMRAIIKKAAPDSVEVISYGMPAFKLHGVLAFCTSSFTLNFTIFVISPAGSALSNGN